MSRRRHPDLQCPRRPRALCGQRSGAHDGRVPLLLIDDASPDGRIAPLLQGMAARFRIRVSTNARNLGLSGP
jgi:hypothetical protein